ncbi:MAG: oligosaccharide flippase family protein, partial [Chloroflexaceae bacterium]|nr:oligosaccharide flippase family protein [Chloroflexaceae bacterium]
MHVLKASSLVWSVSLIGIIIGVIQTRVLATQLGPEGIGLYGQCLALLAVLQMPIGNGLLNAAVRYVAASHVQHDYATTHRLIAHTQTLVLLTVAVLGGALLMTAPYLAAATLGSAEQGGLIVLLALGLPCAAAASTLQAFLRAFERIDYWAVASAVPLVLGLPLLVGLVLLFGLYGALLQISLLGLITATIGLLLYRRIPVVREGPLLALRLDRTILRQLLMFGGVHLVTSASFAGSFVVARSLVIHGQGLEAAGLYQVVLSISMQYLGIALFSLTVYWYPHISALAEDEAVIAATNLFLRVALFTITPLLVGVVLLRDILITLVYGPDFAAAAVLILWQAPGDYLRIISSILAVPILTGMQLRAYLLIGVGRDICFLSLFAVLLVNAGLIGGAVAYLLVNVLTVGVVLVYQRHWISFRFYARQPAPDCEFKRSAACW